MDQPLLNKNHYSLEIINDVNEICKPFFDEFGIKSFCYLRYFKDGSVFICISHRELYQHHMDEGYLITPNIDESYSKKRYHYFPMQGLNDGFNQAVFDYQSLFGISNFIYFFEVHSDYIDLFTFSATESRGAINHLSHHIPVFENFKYYFKDKAAKLIEQSNSNRIQLPESMCSSIPGFNAPSQQFMPPNQFTPKKYWLAMPNVYLTTREKEIVRYIAKGYSSKEIAKIIQLSHRTIETHWQAIKSKFNLQKKYQVIEKAEMWGII